MGVQAVLSILLLLVATVKTEDERVSFWREKFTMTCPGSGEWYKGDKKEEGRNASVTYELTYNSDTRGLYYCQYKNADDITVKYYFYVKGRACENCFELDPIYFALVIVMDLIGTIGVIFIIYRFTSKKSSDAPPQTPRAAARSAGRAPPVPSPDYEKLNPQTRTVDTYSTVNRTG